MLVSRRHLATLPSVMMVMTLRDMVRLVVMAVLVEVMMIVCREAPQIKERVENNSLT